MKNNETRIRLDEEDFKTLVSGNTVGQDNTKIILADIGYQNMLNIISSLLFAPEIGAHTMKGSEDEWSPIRMKQAFQLCKGCPTMFFNMSFYMKKSGDVRIATPQITINKDFSRWEMLKFAIHNLFGKI